MISWRRESDAEPPWATWGLLAVTFLAQLGAGGSPELQERLGLVPADPSLPAFFGHLLVHDDWLSLFATLFFAAAAGPALEARLGRGLLLGSWLACGLCGAALLVATGAELPWLGPSLAVAGWLGLLLASTRGERVDLLGIAAGRAGSLWAPAWAPAALWLGGELAGTHDALLVSVGSFGVGAALAFALEKSGRVERAVSAAPGAPRGATLRALPKHPAQLEALLGEAADPAVAHAYLAQAEVEGRRSSARAVVTERLREAMEGRRREPAVALWCALAATGTVPTSSPDKLLQLASWVRAAGHPGEGAAALHAALASADPAAAAKIARSARRSDPVICYRAAERALAADGLGASDKSALEGLQLEAAREVASRGVILVPAAAAAAALAARTASAPGAVVRAPGAQPVSRRALAHGEAIELAPDPDLAPPPPPALPDPERSGDGAFLDAFHAALHADAEPEPKDERPPLRALRVREAAPTALDGDTLVVEVPERGPIRLRLTRIHAIALAGVRGISARAGDKPVLLVDLCLSAEGEPDLQVLRLRSDRFDPRRLAPGGETSPLKALRAFVAALANAAHAPLLPAEDVAGDAPLRIFGDLATYQREVLGAA